MSSLPPAAWLAIALACAASDAQAVFVVNQPWARPATKGQSTEVYMDLTSSEGATLVAVKSADAARTSILAPGTRARSIERLELPAAEMVRLKSGGYRIALDRLARNLALGESVALTLTIESADGSRQDIPVSAEARRRSPIDDERRAHSQPH
jgi:copper(I)-binding protein